MLGNSQITVTLEAAENIPSLGTELVVTGVKSDHPARVVKSQQLCQHTLSTLGRTKDADSSKQT